MSARIMHMTKIGFFVPFSSYCIWNGLILLKEKSVRDNTPSQAFPIGSMNETIMDSLETGDLVAFNLNWFWMRSPVEASLCAFRKYVLLQEFNQYGVIVVDRLGQRFVVEPTASGRPRIQPYSSRILHSLADEIYAIPLKMKRSPEFRVNAEEVLSTTRTYALSSIWTEWQQALLAMWKNEPPPVKTSCSGKWLGCN